MEELKKRKAEEELQNYRKKVQMKQQVEKKSMEDFRCVVKSNFFCFLCVLDVFECHFVHV